MDDNAPTRKNHELYQWLLRKIQSGAYEHLRFPGERVLAKQHNVSRTTVRHALRDLQANGYITSTERFSRHVPADKFRKLKFLWLSSTPLDMESPSRLKNFEMLQRRINCRGDELVSEILHFDASDIRIIDSLGDYDGIVLSGIFSQSILPEIRNALKKCHNVVSIQNAGDIATASCSTNNWMIGEIAASYLLDCGFEHIAVLGISPTLNRNYFIERINGFISYCMKHAQDPKTFQMVLAKNKKSLQDPTSVVLPLYKQGVRAIFAITDHLAIKCIQALTQAGVKVPENISVLGCDNLESGADAPVPLTTFSHPYEEITEFILEKLYENLKGHRRKEPVHISISPKLVERKSVRHRPNGS